MTIQIGSIVRPTIGPHKGETHEVIHIFEDGHANIRLIEGESEYASTHVTSDPKYLIVEEVLMEEYTDPHGAWWHDLPKKTKEAYRSNHPLAQGSFGHEPGSTKHQRALSKSHLNYANWHKDQMDHHRDKKMDSLEGKFNSDRHAHHSQREREHGELFYHHSMKHAHHDAVAAGGRAPIFDQPDRVPGPH